MGVPIGKWRPKEVAEPKCLYTVKPREAIIENW